MIEEKIRELSNEELRNEIKKYCRQQVKNGSCTACIVSGIHHLDDITISHRAVNDIDDRYTLGLMVALIRGYLVWDESRSSDNREEFDTGSNVPEQPTVPPMPEPMESVIGRETELTISAEGNLLVDGYADVPDDMTVIRISGKKPTSMTVFYDQEGGGADGT